MKQIGLSATVLLMLVSRAAAAPQCLGDCDGDGVITPEEFECTRPCIHLVTNCPSDACLACVDANDDGMIAISELVHVANNAAQGCPGHRRCDGDCDGDGRVRVDEVLAGVGGALHGGRADDSCPEFTFCPLGQRCIDVASLQRAVAHALHGCPQ